MALRIVGGAVRELRQAHGWTGTEFAALADLSQGYLSKIETGKAIGRPATMWQIADALGVEPIAITGDKKAFNAALRAAMRSPKARTQKAAA